MVELLEIIPEVYPEMYPVKAGFISIISSFPHLTKIKDRTIKRNEILCFKTLFNDIMFGFGCVNI